MYDLTSQRVLAGAAGAGEKIYVEDVFSTWLYTGNDSTQTITNGIDLSGKGGLVWIKARNSNALSSLYGDAVGNNILYDTSMSFSRVLSTAKTNAIVNASPGAITSVSSTGFGVTYGGSFVDWNSTGINYASWTFRKAAKFFDVVTWTGNGATGTISHNLGSVPGCIIVKRTDASFDWYVYHRSQGETKAAQLNATDAFSGSAAWDNTAPTSTQFTWSSILNASGATYVAYLFAHDAGGFGDSGNDSVVKCGSFTTDGSGNATVDLGWEPQWLLYKSSSNIASWLLVDTMRGYSLSTTDDKVLYPNLSNAEDTANYGNPTATGFSVASGGASRTYIYIAIRRGPMKTPTDATKVFSAIKQTSSGKNTTNFALDAQLSSAVVSDDRIAFFANRLTGVSTNSTPLARGLVTSSTAAEGTTNATTYNTLNWDNTGFDSSPQLPSGSIYWSFRRAPGFFDVAAWTASASTSITHGLGVTPELIIAKSRSVAGESWTVYTQAGGRNNVLFLNTTNGNTGIANYWGTSGPTTTTFGVAASGSSNNAGNMIAYLFASCPGVSKVGNYTGTGTTLQVNCGFTSGARFVLIKRTDSTGDWYVWDSARGIVAGNDPYLLLNSTAAEVTGTDYVDTFSSGFEISSTAPAAINANGGSFIFLAVA